MPLNITALQKKKKEEGSKKIMISILKPHTLAAAAVKITDSRTRVMFILQFCRCTEQNMVLRAEFIFLRLSVIFKVVLAPMNL